MDNDELSELLKTLDIFELHRDYDSRKHPQFRYWNLKGTGFWFIDKGEVGFLERSGWRSLPPKENPPPADGRWDINFETVLESVEESIRTKLLFHLDVFTSPNNNGANRN